LLLTRQGISLLTLIRQTVRIGRRLRLHATPSLHVAMQMGPSHDPVSWISGVWPLRILISSCLDVFRFIVSTISAISIRPQAPKCLPSSIIRIHSANFSKSRCFAVRSGSASKNGIIRSNEVCPSVHDELAQILAMIVMPLGDIDATDAEEALELFQRRYAANALRHDESVRHLIPGSVASAICSTWLPNKTQWRNIPLRLQSR
jgi:hypothetical protein